MLKIRVIPCLQLIDDSLVKTIKFKNHGYIGDPINTVRIFNELEVDELCFLDIRATSQKRDPNFQILEQIANECFMPLSYGGGIDSLETAQKIFSIGFEKIVLNTAAIKNPSLISEIAEVYGNQSIIVSIDVKKVFLGGKKVISYNGKEKTKLDPVDWAKKVESYGAGEILLTSIDNEGTWEGYNVNLLKSVTDAVEIPVIAHGGAGNLDHIKEAISNGNVSAVALGSMVVYQSKGLGVLVNFPDRKKLEETIKNQ